MRAVRTARPVGLRLADRGPALAAGPDPGRLHRHAQRVPNDVIALHAGYPDRELLPERLVRSALTRAVRGDTALSRPPAAGLPELQSWFAHELGTASPVGVTPPTPSDVIVLPGSQSGLSSIFRALVATGQPLLMESPTYWGAIPAAAQAGVRVVPVPDRPRRARPRRAGARLRGDRRPAVLRAAELREPHRRAVVDRTRTSRSWTSCATTAPSSSRTTGPTTSASPPRPPRRRARRRRPRRLPALADQERVPGPPHRRRHRPRPGPRTHPRRPRSRVDVRQRPAPGSRPRRRDPTRAGKPTCAACANSSEPAATCSSTACASTPRRPTSTTCPPAG